MYQRFHRLQMFQIVLGCMMACHSPETPHPLERDASRHHDQSIDAGGAGGCTEACDTLAYLNCPEAEQRDGGDTCRSVCMTAELGKFGLKPACVAAAKSVTEVRACGTVRCRR